MKKFIVFTLLICLSFLFTSCATTSGAIETSIQYYDNRAAIYIDDIFIYEPNFIKDLPVGYHHIVAKHPNKTLMDTTIYVSNEWSIQNKAHSFLGLAISAGMALIPFPSSILYFLTVPIPVIIAYLYNREGAFFLNVKTGPDPILTKIDSTIRIQIKPNASKNNSEADSLDAISTYISFEKTNKLCYDKNAPIEPLVWFLSEKDILYAIPRKHVSICTDADYPFISDCAPVRDFILEEHLCPQL